MAAPIAIPIAMPAPTFPIAAPNATPSATPTAMPAPIVFKPIVSFGSVAVSLPQTKSAAGSGQKRSFIQEEDGSGNVSYFGTPSGYTAQSGAEAV